MKKLPLRGIRVADVTLVWAGPHCTQLHAEWGAEVIRVEPLQRPQPATRSMGETRPSRALVKSFAGTGSMSYTYPDREPGQRPWNRTAAFNSHARNKLSMTLDIMRPEGRDVFLRLVSICDVLVENNVPETIEKAHLTYEELAKVNPSLIMLRMPGYGLTGPYKNYRSFGTHMEGLVGHHYIRSYRDVDPSYTGEAFTADAAAGVMGAFAVAMALRHRRRTGQGQQIELPQAENFVSFLGEFVLDYTMNGRVTPPQGNSHRAYVPHNVYPCAGDDRWIAIAVTSEEEWQALCRALGRPDLASDPRFQDPTQRKRHEEELDRLLAEWTRERDAYEVFHLLQAHGVPSGPVQNERDAYACPHLAERGFFEELAHPEAGTHRYPGLNLRLSRTPNHLRTPPPLLGEHNEEVYRHLLGLSEEEYARLEALGHIGMDYPESVP